MRLSTMEFVAMNNFVRRWILKWIEFRLFNHFLREHNVELLGGVILDVGCGSGHSTKLIGSQYKPSELVAFDMMPEQIELAKRTYREARFIVGDATEIDSPSDKYDAVFVFGVLHHIPKWKIKAQVKLARVGAAISIQDFTEIRGNRFETLKGDRKGQYSIRINDQYLICFRWEEENAVDVEISDYH